MLENVKTAVERWNGVDQIVNKLLGERQELLVLYCSVCGVQPVRGSDRPPIVEVGRSVSKIQQLCGILVDYVSAGHFEVYEQLLREADTFKQDGVGLLARHYPAIERSTEASLSFSDKYVETRNYREMSRDLSRLGEALEARFEAEDALIEAMHSSHRKEVA